MTSNNTNTGNTNLGIRHDEYESAFSHYDYVFSLFNKIFTLIESKLILSLNDQSVDSISEAQKIVENEHLIKEEYENYLNNKASHQYSLIPFDEVIAKSMEILRPIFHRVSSSINPVELHICDEQYIDSNFNDNVRNNNPSFNVLQPILSLLQSYHNKDKKEQSQELILNILTKFNSHLKLFSESHLVSSNQTFFDNIASAQVNPLKGNIVSKDKNIIRKILPCILPDQHNSNNAIMKTVYTSSNEIILTDSCKKDGAKSVFYNLLKLLILNNRGYNFFTTPITKKNRSIILLLNSIASISLDTINNSVILKLKDEDNIDLIKNSLSHSLLSCYHASLYQRNLCNLNNKASEKNNDEYVSSIENAMTQSLINSDDILAILKQYDISNDSIYSLIDDFKTDDFVSHDKYIAMGNFNTNNLMANPKLYDYFLDYVPIHTELSSFIDNPFSDEPHHHHEGCSHSHHGSSDHQHSSQDSLRNNQCVDLKALRKGLYNEQKPNNPFTNFVVMWNKHNNQHEFHITTNLCTLLFASLHKMASTAQINIGYVDAHLLTEDVFDREEWYTLMKIWKTSGNITVKSSAAPSLSSFSGLHNASVGDYSSANRQLIHNSSNYTVYGENISLIHFLAGLHTRSIHTLCLPYDVSIKDMKDIINNAILEIMCGRKFDMNSFYERMGAKNFSQFLCPPNELVSQTGEKFTHRLVDRHDALIMGDQYFAILSHILHSITVPDIQHIQTFHAFSSTPKLIEQSKKNNAKFSYSDLLNTHPNINEVTLKILDLLIRNQSSASSTLKYDGNMKYDQLSDEDKNIMHSFLLYLTTPLQISSISSSILLCDELGIPTQFHALIGLLLDVQRVIVQYTIDIGKQALINNWSVSAKSVVSYNGLPSLFLLPTYLESESPDNLQNKHSAMSNYLIQLLIYIQNLFSNFKKFFIDINREDSNLSTENIFLVYILNNYDFILNDNPNKIISLFINSLSDYMPNTLRNEFLTIQNTLNMKWSRVINYLNNPTTILSKDHSYFVDKFNMGNYPMDDVTLWGDLHHDKKFQYLYREIHAVITLFKEFDLNDQITLEYNGFRNNRDRLYQDIPDISIQSETQNISKSMPDWNIYSSSNEHISQMINQKFWDKIKYCPDKVFLPNLIIRVLQFHANLPIPISDSRINNSTTYDQTTLINSFPQLAQPEQKEMMQRCIDYMQSEIDGLINQIINWPQKKIGLNKLIELLYIPNQSK